MGLTKAEMMRQEELEPMYEWIADQFDYDSVEEGTAEWAEAEKAYYQHCIELQELEKQELLEADLEWYLHVTSPKRHFDSQIASVNELLSVEVSTSAQFSLLVMLHAHLVASIEAYFASFFIQQVTSSDFLIRKLVETDPTFSEMKFTMKDIYEKHENLNRTVAKYLKDLIFHDIKKIKPMFRDVLDFDFGDIVWLFKAVELRHNCVHRAGRDKEGNKVELTVDSITKLIAELCYIANKIELSCNSNPKDDDKPF